MVGVLLTVPTVATIAGLERDSAAASVQLDLPHQMSATASPTYEPWQPGGTWTVLHGPAREPLWRSDPPDLRGVSLVHDGDGALRGWAVGEEGALARFDGSRWQAVGDFDPRSTAPRTYDFHDVFVKAVDDVWVVGKITGDAFCEGCGTMLHYDGQRWRELDRYEGFRVNGRMGALNALDMRQDESGNWHGWAVGDDADFDRFKAVILHYQPDDTWPIWPANNIAKNLYDVRLVSASEAWAVGQDGVESRYNEDSGQGIWPPLGRSGSDTLYAVDLADSLSGWDGGFRGRMNKYIGYCHDDDPGTTCWFENRAMPIKTESGSQWAITIYAIDLLGRDRGWLVGAASGRVSTVAWCSGARQWTLARVQDDPGRDLRALQMLTPRLGYAVGDDGVILRYLDDSVPTATATTPATTVPSATVTFTALPATVTASPGAPDPTATVTVEPSATSDPPGDTPTATVASATDVPTDTARPTSPDELRVLRLPLLMRR